MTMLLITKELAEAVVASHTKPYLGLRWCDHCIGKARNSVEIKHTPECIVTRAKLLLEQEWDIKS